jgi:hypothetical protein
MIGQNVNNGVLGLPFLGRGDQEQASKILLLPSYPRSFVLYSAHLPI